MLAARLPTRPASGGRPRLDVLGAILVTSSTASLIYALIASGERWRLTALTAPLVLTAAVGYALFVLRQRRVRSPLMDVRLLARRPVATGAMRTGPLFLPVAPATMLGADLTGRAVGRSGARGPAIAGLAVAAIGMAVPAASTHPVSVVVWVANAAAGTGAMYVIASATAPGQVEPHEAGIASGIVSTLHEFGASFGAAVVSNVAAASLVGTTPSGFTKGVHRGGGRGCGRQSHRRADHPWQVPHRRMIGRVRDRNGSRSRVAGVAPCRRRRCERESLGKRPERGPACPASSLLAGEGRGVHRVFCTARVCAVLVG
ncbi:hypothetical protein [Actinoallomurus sp. NPDC052274]|uniref:hypothetical protein n=1 Tax=Actinoallomurus sp. NPDC052274 TaxID=3155420 RepID=UPI00341D122D